LFGLLHLNCLYYHALTFTTMAPTSEEENAASFAAVEEGVPASNTNSAQGRPMVKRLPSRRLSLTSMKYDVDGDGKLDAAEQAMRDMDKEGLGYLSNDKVHTIFQEQLRMQKQLLLAKRIIILCASLLVILAVANVGVSFAAANLAKDTKTQNNVLVVKDTGQVVQTDIHGYVFDVTPDTSRRRELQFYGQFNCSVAGECLVQPTAATSLEVLRLCYLGLPVILNYTSTGRCDYPCTDKIVTKHISYHVCNNDPTVTETITVNTLRDGSVSDYNVTRPSTLLEFSQNPADPEAAWSFTVTE
jgi:hypothetical protein